MSSLDNPRSLLFAELTRSGRGYGALNSAEVLPTTHLGTTSIFGGHTSTNPKLIPSNKSASKRQRQVRTLNVRERLNLPPEESTQDGSVQDQARNVMAAYCNVEEYDTQQLVQALPGRAVLIGDVATVASSATNADVAQSNPNGPPIAFFFPYGCAVLWGFTESETQELLSLAETFANGILPEVERSFDCMGFQKASKTTSTSKRGRSKRFLERHHSLESVVSAEGEDRSNKGVTRLNDDHHREFEEEDRGVYSDGYDVRGGLDDGYTHREKRREEEDDGGFASSPKNSPRNIRSERASQSSHSVSDQRSNINYIVDQIPPYEAKDKKICEAHFRTNSAGVFSLSDTMDPLAKLSVSYAFAQSGKLETLENGVDVLVEDLRPIPEQLANTGRCNFSGRDVARATGRTFLLSSTANLYSDILDEPDFFWEEDAYLPIYARASAYLDNDQRTKILNSRIDVIQKLLESLNDQLTTEHGHHLEIIVIILIVVEVVLDIMRWGDLF